MDDQKTITLKLLGFKSFSRLNWPTPYQEYRVTLVIAQLPDYVWQEAENSYGPVIRNMERLTVTETTEWYSANAELRDICVTAVFDQPALQQPGTTVMVAVGLELKSSTLNSSGPGTMKIVACFVSKPNGI